MEEVGTQLSPSIYIHQSLSGRFLDSHPLPKKRNLPFRPTNSHHLQQSHQQPQPQPQRQPAGFQDSRGHWNPQAWDWDSSRFLAKPLESDLLRAAPSTYVQCETQRNRNDECGEPNSGGLSKNCVGEDDESLLLKLGGGLVHNCVEEPVSRPSKRVRSGSPGGWNYPMCQVDDCKEDLSPAKDYHRRHKVCEVHSKATQALVGKQMQRFCQQCSRFHPLSEFDEGKRSCRRRLAGHNRRRRKTQPDDVTSRLLPPGNKPENVNNEGMDIVNLLAILARGQGNSEDSISNCLPVPNEDQIIQIIQKINSLPLPADFTAKLPLLGGSNKNVLDLEKAQTKSNGSNSSSSTLDLLAVLSGTGAAPSPDGLAVPSQRCSHGNDMDQPKSCCHNQTSCLNLQNEPAVEFPSAGKKSSTSYQSPVQDSDCQVLENCTNLQLQLFSSSPENDSPPELASGRKYFSSDSSTLMEERSPSSSPPFVQKLFPTQTLREAVKPESMSTSEEFTGNVKAGRTEGCFMSFDLFGGANGGTNNGFVQSYPDQAGYTSSSGSDHSPSSSSSDAQDRTGRILFKLFDKNPSQLPGTLRTQIYNWLSQSPSEMESYIRPGCVVLSIYISMSPSAWEQLEDNFIQHVTALVQHSDEKFWRNGRFVVHIGTQLASHLGGKVHLHKALRAWSFPEVISISPLAVVAGQETSILLKGRNLSSQDTKVYCTHGVRYTLNEVPRSADTLYDEISLNNFTISMPYKVLGRCYIEVENGFRGTSFPIIIANATICQELRCLESAFGEATEQDSYSEGHVNDSGRPRTKEEVLHYLNELGWIFQRKGISSELEAPEYKLHRFKFLFIFSVERDFCVLVKTLLDILLEICLGRNEISRESLEMLLEIHLPNRAVKRRSIEMVYLLINYSVPSITGTGKKYIFTPNLAGPGGITPLHLAACSSDCDAMVDILTNDPQEIGLQSWDSLLDGNGLSPHDYALMRNNLSYNELVARKIADKKNGQVSLSIGDEIQDESLSVGASHRASFQVRQTQLSCSKCAILASKYSRKASAAHVLLHRTYIHSMLAIAAVCVCVCLFLRGAPDIGSVAPFEWEDLGYGSV